MAVMKGRTAASRKASLRLAAELKKGDVLYQEDPAPPIRNHDFIITHRVVMDVKSSARTADLEMAVIHAMSLCPAVIKIVDIHIHSDKA